jgi:ketosteroid isomerase-like protein
MTPGEFLSEYETSGRVGGVDHTLNLIDENAVYWFSDGTSHVGKAAVERAIRRNFDVIKEEVYRISDVVWIAQGTDIAVCIYRFGWSGIIRGAAMSGSGRGTMILARRNESWVVVHEHLSKGEHAV